MTQLRFGNPTLLAVTQAVRPSSRHDQTVLICRIVFGLASSNVSGNNWAADRQLSDTIPSLRVMIASIGPNHQSKNNYCS